MDILGMLAGLKNKVLDAAHYELLRGAYELQSQNIDQLKINNDALRENNELLKEKAAALHKEANALKAQLEQLQKLSFPVSEYRPDGVARRILKLYAQSGKTGIDEEEIKGELRCSDVEFSAAVRELKKHEVLECKSSSHYGGDHLSLSASGEELVLRGIA
jgi:hypothetical protein